MTESLLIMKQKANELLQHRDELQAILSTKNILICLISETSITKKSYLKLLNQKIHHIVHPPNTRGGSAYIIK